MQYKIKNIITNVIITSVRKNLDNFRATLKRKTELANIAKIRTF